MGIRTIVHTVLFLSVFGLNAQTEEQLKFSIPDSVREYDILLGLDSLEGMYFVQHSEYMYYDIYFDTPDNLLLTFDYTLRMRKRVFNDSTCTYSMQLKSEMSEESAVRVEIEEKELDFYRFVNEHNDVMSVTDLMDQMFFVAGLDGVKAGSVFFRKYTKSLNSWIQSVVGAPITPFQYLLHHDSEEFTLEELRTLEVKSVGESHRIRGHVYAPMNNALSVEQQFLKESPAFFEEHPDAIWLMETSLDLSHFKSVDQYYKRITLREFEVERKHPDTAVLSELMDVLSRELESNYGLVENRLSKYVQVFLDGRNESKPY